MKYLFTYSYKGKNCGRCENGEGSMVMTLHGTDKITPRVIESAVEIVKQHLNAEGIQIDALVPMGWYKFDDEEGSDNNNAQS